MSCYIHPRQRARANQLKFAKQRKFIRGVLATAKKTPKTDIWIYCGPFQSYKAVVGVDEDSVWIIWIFSGKLTRIVERRCIGFRENGTLLYDKKEDGKSIIPWLYLEKGISFT